MDHTRDLLDEATILPPAPDKCQVCGAKHEPNEPHDATSLYYQFAFKKEHGRWPTWVDAMAHMNEQGQRDVKEVLTDMGIDWEAGVIFPSGQKKTT